MRRLRQRLARQAGFTLVELVMVVAVFGIVAPALTLVLTSSIRWSDDVQEGSVRQFELRSAIDQLARDLRQAYTGDTTAIVETATPTTIVFYSPDRSTPFRLRKLAYRVQSGRLERSTTTSTNAGAAPWTFPAAFGAYVPQVRGLLGSGVFTYLDSNGAATTNPVLIRQVLVNMTISSGLRGNRPFAYQTAVTLRGAA